MKPPKAQRKIKIHGLSPVSAGTVDPALISARTEGIHISVEELQQTALNMGHSVKPMLREVPLERKSRCLNPGIEHLGHRPTAKVNFRSGTGITM